MFAPPLMLSFHEARRVRRELRTGRPPRREARPPPLPPLPPAQVFGGATAVKQTDLLRLIQPHIVKAAAAVAPAAAPLA